MDNTLESVAPAILEKGLELTVDVEYDKYSMKGKFKTFLQRLKLLPKKRTFVIKPVRTGSLIKISDITIKIDVDVESLKGDDFDKKSFQIIRKHGRDIAKIIAMVIVNREEDPEEDMIDFILWNFKPSELLASYFICRNSMDLTSFMSTIILISGINLLTKKSPVDQRSQIASGSSSEE